MPLILTDSQLNVLACEGQVITTMRLPDDQQPPETIVWSPENTGHLQANQPIGAFWRYGTRYGTAPAMRRPFPDLPYKAGDIEHVLERWCVEMIAIRSGKAFACVQYYDTAERDIEIDAEGLQFLDLVGPTWQPAATMPTWLSRTCIRCLSCKVQRLVDAIWSFVVERSLEDYVDRESLDKSWFWVTEWEIYREPSDT